MTLPSDPFFPAHPHGAADALSPLIGRLLFLFMYCGQTVLVTSLLLTQPGALSHVALVTGIVGYAGFGLCLAGSSWPGAPRTLRVALTAAMSICSLMFNLTFSRLEGFTALSLQVVSAIVIVTVVPSRMAAAWIVLQSLALAWANAWGVSVVYKALLYPSYTLLQLFSAYLMKVVLIERRQRLEVIRLNQELRRARDAVAQATQAAERHRIARDLHDTLGHRLSALGLELEYAFQVSHGREQQAVERAQFINRQLLSEVRQTVSAIRDPEDRSLERQLAELGDQFTALDVQVECDPGLPLSADLRDTLLKCAREAVTNAVRHAGATTVQVQVSHGPDTASLRVRNAVSGASPRVREGHGLRGMRERLEAVGGHLRVSSGPGAFEVEARVPLAGAWVTGP